MLATCVASIQMKNKNKIFYKTHENPHKNHENSFFDNYFVYKGCNHQFIIVRPVMKISRLIYADISRNKEIILGR